MQARPPSRWQDSPDLSHGPCFSDPVLARSWSQGLELGSTSLWDAAPTPWANSLVATFCAVGTVLWFPFAKLQHTVHVFVKY